MSDFLRVWDIETNQLIRKALFNMVKKANAISHGFSFFES